MTFIVGGLVGGISCLVGYVIGVLRERKSWNDLIDAGILPAPRRRNG